MRVVRDEVFRLAVEVGEVTATSAGDEDLLARPLGALKHRHAPPAPAGFHRAHQAGSARAEDDSIKIMSQENFSRLHQIVVCNRILQPDGRNSNGTS
jgi:hypothetical protein